MARPLEKWMARATTSLPAPLSPSMRTVVESLPERREASARTCSIPADRPTSAASACPPPRRSSVSAWICRRVRAVVRARSTAASSAWKGNGFTRKSMAPCFMASTAMSTVLCADIMSTASSGDRPSALCSVTRPSMPGSLTSSRTRSGDWAARTSRASSPDSAVSTS